MNETPLTNPFIIKEWFTFKKEKGGVDNKILNSLLWTMNPLVLAYISDQYS